MAAAQVATSGEHPWSATGEDTGEWGTFRSPVEHSLRLGAAPLPAGNRSFLIGPTPSQGIEQVQGIRKGRQGHCGNINIAETGNIRRAAGAGEA